jgi:hypothetical protein
MKQKTFMRYAVLALAGLGIYSVIAGKPFWTLPATLQTFRARANGNGNGTVATPGGVQSTFINPMINQSFPAAPSNGRVSRPSASLPTR